MHVARLGVSVGVVKEEAAAWPVVLGKENGGMRKGTKVWKCGSR